MEPEQVDARLTALERDVARLDERQAAIAADAQAARVLAAGADREVAQIAVELRAHRQLLNALRETQRDHEGRLNRIEDRLERVEDRLERVESQLLALDERMAAGFATMQTGMTQIVALLTDSR